jgi:hypothetical protein
MRKKTCKELLVALKKEHESEFEGSNGCVGGEDCPTCKLIAKAEWEVTNVQT